MIKKRKKLLLYINKNKKERKMKKNYIDKR